MAVNPKHVAAN